MIKLINKSTIKIDKTTNATGILAIVSGLAATIGGITNDQPVYVWLPTLCLSISGAISQWLQGEPSSETLMIAKVLDLQPGMTNSDLARSLVRRFVGEQPKPAPKAEPPLAQKSRPIAPPEQSQPSWGHPPTWPRPEPSGSIATADFPRWQAEALAGENDEITQF
jgi:hypothetical protein